VSAESTTVRGRPAWTPKFSVPATFRRRGTDAAARTVRLPLVISVTFFVIGGLIRIWVLRSPLGDADSDEAVTGLMAMHFLDGEIHALYWGANYAGTLEPILTAGLFWLVGPSIIALKAIPIVLTLAAALLVWRASQEYFGEGYGPLEGAVFWIFPAASLLLLMKAQVVYASGSCFMVLLLMLALRMRRDANPIHFVLFGFITGLSLWATPLALATIIPMAAVVFLVTWRKHVMNLLAIPAAMVGAFPWLAYSVRNNWVTLQQVGTLQTTYGSRVKGCFLELYPLLLGLRKPITLQWVLGPTIGPLLYLVLFGAMIAVPVWRYRAKVLPLVVPVLVFPFLYAASTTNWYTAEPRHGMLIAPLLLMLAVAIVPRALPAQIGAFALALALTVSSLGFVRDMGDTHPGLATVRPGKLAPVIQTMKTQGLDSCYADYWIAYRLVFESKEHIICAAYWGDRYPPYRLYADAHQARTYLFLANTASADGFRDRLEQLRLPFTEKTFDTVDMFVLDSAHKPEEINSCVKVDWLDQPTCPGG
jgi:hypothetical protein